MVGGLFGVHNIDMGMCSSFARVFDIRKKKSFFFYIIFYGMVVVELPCFFHSCSSFFFFSPCAFTFSRFFSSASHGLFSRVKSAWQDICVLWEFLEV